MHSTVIVTPKAVYDSDSLKEKEFFFTKFLNDLWSNEELWACEYVEKFLTVQTEKEYKHIRKTYEKSSNRPSELNEYSTIDGKVNINVSPNNAEICRIYQSKFINKCQAVLKNLEEATEEIEK